MQLIAIAPNKREYLDNFFLIAPKIYMLEQGSIDKCIAPYAHRKSLWHMLKKLFAPIGCTKFFSNDAPFFQLCAMWCFFLLK